jgi:hypothetical protein
MILSRGMNLRLQALPKTEKLLQSRVIEYHIEQTPRAIEMFNKLMRQGKKSRGELPCSHTKHGHEIQDS